MNPSETEKQAMKQLYHELCTRVWNGINTGDATPHIEWLATQPTKLVRDTILFTQPNGWAVLAVKWVESLDDHQACAVLAALVAVFVQAAGRKP